MSVLKEIFGFGHARRRAARVARAGIMALALLGLVVGTARADILFAVSNYVTGSIGRITQSGGRMVVEKDLVTNLGLDAFAYSFVDPAGRPFGILREYHYGPNDHVMLYDLGATEWWKAPSLDARWDLSNIHGVCSSGRYLYVTTYESYDDSAPSTQRSGELLKLDMEDGYRIVGKHRWDEFQEDGKTWQPHCENVMAIGDHIYVLWSISEAPMPMTYLPSVLVKMTPDLVEVGRANVGKNTGNLSSGTMAFYGGKLYIAAMGGWQGPGTWGDLYEVDIETMASRKVVDGHDIVVWKDAAHTEQAAVGMYGVAIAPDGTAWILGGSYDGNFDEGYDSFFAVIQQTTAERLSRGDVGTRIADFGAEGYSWTVMYDKDMGKLWAMTGTNLYMYGKSGALEKVFSPSDLGDPVYSISIIGRGGRIDWKGSSDPGPSPDPGDDEPGDDDPDDPVDPIDHDAEGETAVTIPWDKDQGHGSSDEIRHTTVYAPGSIASDADAIKAAGGISGTVASLKESATARVSAARSELSARLGSAAGDDVASLLVTDALAGGAIVFRPSFTLDGQSTTLGGAKVPVPTDAASFAAAFAFRLAFQDGSTLDITEDELPGLVRIGPSANGEQAIVALEATIVLIDGTAPADAMRASGIVGVKSAASGGAGIKLDGKYLYVWDGVPDGREDLGVAIVRKSAGPSPDPVDPVEPVTPKDEGGGGGGCSAMSMGWLLLALSALAASKRERG